MGDEAELPIPDRDAMAYLRVPPDTTRRELESRMVELPVELGGIFGQDGRLKSMPKLGDDRSISWCGSELESMRDADVTHSHPGGGAFSDTDLRSASKHDLHALRAVSIVLRKRVSVYVIRRPKGGWQAGVSEDDLVAFLARYLNKAENDVRESLADIQAMPEFPELCRRARLSNAYSIAERRAKDLISANVDVVGLSRLERDAVRERYTHHQLSQALREIGVEYRREEPDAD